MRATYDSRYGFCQDRRTARTLYFGVLAITALFALMVVVYVVYCAIKYGRDTDDKVGVRATSWMPLELGWSLIPFFIAISTFVWASIVLVHIVRGR